MREDHMTSYGIGMKIENPAYIVSLSFSGLGGITGSSKDERSHES